MSTSRGNPDNVVGDDVPCSHTEKLRWVGQGFIDDVALDSASVETARNHVDHGDPVTAEEEVLRESIGAMVASEGFPCLGARSVFRREHAVVRVYDELASQAATVELLSDLARFAEKVDAHAGFASFVAIFRAPMALTEKEFEELLWAQLRLLHAADEQAWNSDVSADPTDDHFAYSLGSTAYFVVGLHPHSSRIARRSVSPTLVFNLHAQFEALRTSGQFERMRDMIRARDEQLQGSINPMVSDHGYGSEARQYAGRAVDEDWVAPFAQEQR